jgi:hypothetical protein
MPSERIHDLWSRAAISTHENSSITVCNAATSIGGKPLAVCRNFETGSQTASDTASNSTNDNGSEDVRYDSDSTICSDIGEGLCDDDDIDAISPTTLGTLVNVLETDHLSGEENIVNGSVHVPVPVLSKEGVPSPVKVVYIAPVAGTRVRQTTRRQAASRAATSTAPSSASASSAAAASKAPGGLATKKKKMRCTCTKTKCLKLYCECFSTGVECETDFCKCLDCHNDGDPSHRKKKEAAVKRLLKKKGTVAFRNESLEKKRAIAEREGCNCKKSRCVRKYCECYAAGLVCRDNCRCEDCGNNGDVPPPPIKRKRKSRAKKFRLIQQEEEEQEGSVADSYVSPTKKQVADMAAALRKPMVTVANKNRARAKRARR